MERSAVFSSRLSVLLPLLVLAGGWFSVEAQQKKSTAPAPATKLKMPTPPAVKSGPLAGSPATPNPFGIRNPTRNTNPMPVRVPFGNRQDAPFPGHQRRMEVERADHSRIFAERGSRGYVQHPFSYRDREFAHRTYYYNGRAYDRYYGRYYYRRGYVYYYAPAYYYRPVFYGWAYYPWARPISYDWGFPGNPWYGYYGYYFTPAPFYPSASLWLTDYMISTSLAAYYQAQVEAAALAPWQGVPPGAAPLTPDVRDLIAAEVQRQIALENAEAQNAQSGFQDAASSSIQRVLTDGLPHVFVAGNELAVVDSAGQECALSEGDALQLVGPPPPDSTVASMLVLASKGLPECAKGSVVTVQITDLQEMQNHMREAVDAGLAQLHDKQGAGGGLPLIPVSAQAPPVKAGFMASAPPPDPNVAEEINQQMPAAPPAQTQVIIGQSIEEVTGTLGPPLKRALLGSQEIYFYQDRKVSFEDGKVTSVVALGAKF